MTRTLYGCLLLTGILLLPGIASAISLRDYTIPESYSREAYIRGALNFKDGNQEQANYDGFLMGWYDTRYSSIPFEWALRADARYDFERGENKENRSDYGYDLFASTYYDRYFGDSRFLSFGSLDAGYRRIPATGSPDEPFVEIGAGVGYGRLYNATVLAKAMRIVDDLILYGVITEQLSDYGYLELARVIDLEDEFRSGYSPAEYKKFWYEAMEDVLRNQGVLTEDNLGAIGILRIEDILEQERFGVRAHGWKIKAGLSYVASDYEDGKDRDPALTTSFELGIPYSYLLQFNERLTYSAIMGSDKEHRVTNVMSVTYEVSSRIDWQNSWTIRASFPSRGDQEDRISNVLTSSFFYYLVNQLWAETTVTVSHLDDGIRDNGNDDIETRVFLGLTYRLR
jgi:hypothetical protein